MGILSQAAELAAATPAARNRYVDFLRALSITFVICGHWLITTAFFDSQTGVLQPIDVLEVMPWTRWLTWIFQVMPVFFIVGGYSNAVSLESARARGHNYAQWLTDRLHRLLTPLLVLLVVWAVVSLLLHLAAVDADSIRFLSRAALLPTWFLAIYTMIVLLAPTSYALWQRWGFASLALYVGLAVAVDWVFFTLHWQAPGWSNYFWVWLAMHHLGFAWRDGRLPGPPRLLALSLIALAALLVLILLGPYPIAMAGSPGEAVSNTLPPKITLIALGLTQFGLLLSLEKPMQALLERQRAWTCTVLINSMIMTIYLWHMTILLLVFAASYLSGGFGLQLEPGTPGWWWTRPLWLGLLATLLLPCALCLSPLERISRPGTAGPLSAPRLVAGAMMAGLGLAAVTLKGFDGDPMSAFNSVTLLLLLGGAAVCGLLPLPFSSSRNRE